MRRKEGSEKTRIRKTLPKSGKCNGVNGQPCLRGLRGKSVCKYDNLKDRLCRKCSDFKRSLEKKWFTKLPGGPMSESAESPVSKSEKNQIGINTQIPIEIQFPFGIYVHKDRVNELVLEQSKKAEMYSKKLQKIQIVKEREVTLEEQKNTILFLQDEVETLKEQIEVLKREKSIAQTRARVEKHRRADLREQILEKDARSMLHKNVREYSVFAKVKSVISYINHGRSYKSTSDALVDAQSILCEVNGGLFSINEITIRRNIKVLNQMIIDYNSNYIRTNNLNSVITGNEDFSPKFKVDFGHWLVFIPEFFSTENIDELRSEIAIREKRMNKILLKTVVGYNRSEVIRKIKLEIKNTERKIILGFNTRIFAPAVRCFVGKGAREIAEVFWDIFRENEIPIPYITTTDRSSKDTKVIRLTGSKGIHCTVHMWNTADNKAIGRTLSSNGSNVGHTNFIKMMGKVCRRLKFLNKKYCLLKFSKETREFLKEANFGGEEGLKKVVGDLKDGNDFTPKEGSPTRIKDIHEACVIIDNNYEKIINLLVWVQKTLDHGDDYYSSTPTSELLNFLENSFVKFTIKFLAEAWNVFVRRFFSDSEEYDGFISFKYLDLMDSWEERANKLSVGDFLNSKSLALVLGIPEEMIAVNVSIFKEEWMDMIKIMRELYEKPPFIFHNIFKFTKEESKQSAMKVKEKVENILKREQERKQIKKPTKKVEEELVVEPTVTEFSRFESYDYIYSKEFDDVLRGNIFFLDKEQREKNTSFYRFSVSAHLTPHSGIIVERTFKHYKFKNLKYHKLVNVEQIVQLRINLKGTKFDDDFFRSKEAEKLYNIAKKKVEIRKKKQTNLIRTANMINLQVRKGMVKQDTLNRKEKEDKMKDTLRELLSKGFEWGFMQENNLLSRLKKKNGRNFKVYSGSEGNRKRKIVKEVMVYVIEFFEKKTIPSSWSMDDINKYCVDKIPMFERFINNKEEWENLTAKSTSSNHLRKDINELEFRNGIFKVRAIGGDKIVPRNDGIPVKEIPINSPSSDIIHLYEEVDNYNDLAEKIARGKVFDPTCTNDKMEIHTNNSDQIENMIIEDVKKHTFDCRKDEMEIDTSDLVQIENKVTNDMKKQTIDCGKDEMEIDTSNSIEIRNLMKDDVKKQTFNNRKDEMEIDTSNSIQIENTIFNDVKVYMRNSSNNSMDTNGVGAEKRWLTIVQRMKKTSQQISYIDDKIIEYGNFLFCHNKECLFCGKMCYGIIGYCEGKKYCQDCVRRSAHISPVGDLGCPKFDPSKTVFLSSDSRVVVGWIGKKPDENALENISICSTGTFFDKLDEKGMILEPEMWEYPYARNVEVEEIVNMSNVKETLKKLKQLGYIVNESSDKFEVYEKEQKRNLFRKNGMGGLDEAIRRDKLVSYYFDKHSEKFPKEMGNIMVYDIEDGGLDKIIKQLFPVNGENVMYRACGHFICSIGAFCLINQAKFQIPFINIYDIARLGWFWRSNAKPGEPEGFAIKSAFILDKLPTISNVLELWIYFLLRNNVRTITGHYILHHDNPIIALNFVRYNPLKVKFKNVEQFEKWFGEILCVHTVDTKVLNQVLSALLKPNPLHSEERKGLECGRWGVSFMLKLINEKYKELHEPYFDSIDSIFIFLPFLSSKQFVYMMCSFITQSKGKAWTVYDAIKEEEELFIPNVLSP